MPEDLTALASNYSNGYGKRKSFWESVFALLGHLTAASIVYIALVLFAWIVSLVFHKLHAVFPFPKEILDFLTTVELYFVYLDALLCSIVMLAGVWRFIRDLGGK